MPFRRRKVVVELTTPSDMKMHDVKRFVRDMICGDIGDHVACIPNRYVIKSSVTVKDFKKVLNAELQRRLKDG